MRTKRILEFITLLVVVGGLLVIFNYNEFKKLGNKSTEETQAPQAVFVDVIEDAATPEVAHFEEPNTSIEEVSDTCGMDDVCYEEVVIDEKLEAVIEESAIEITPEDHEQIKAVEEVMSIAKDYESVVQEEIIVPEEEMVEAVDAEEVVPEVPVEPIETKKIAIILTDIAEDNIDSAIKYLSDFKYIGMAFEYNSYDAMKKAKDAGFSEVIASIVMEPFNENIELPQEALTTAKMPEENVAVLDDLLENAYEPIAIMNKMGSKVTSSKYMDTLVPIMDEVKSKNLGFVDSKSNFYSVAGDIAGVKNIPYAASYMYFARDNSSEAVIFDSLDELKLQAKKDGSVLAIGDYSANTIRALNIWLLNLAQDPLYEIVPVSVLMK